MSSSLSPSRSAKLILGACLLFSALTIRSSHAMAGEREFLVMLANSPKQYPGPDRDPPGQPTGGLIDRQLIYQQYFDRRDPQIGSFAEYWEEISYGDVTISGNTTDWINLPWAIQPPLVDPLRDDPITGPPVDDDLDDPALRISPANFYDLNDSGIYEYGAGERFHNFFAASIIDADGDPNGTDNGPTQVGPGSLHHTEAPFFAPVWKPGERFVDMDEDGRWDALDEANNQMDWDQDGMPDLQGPWVDLNDNGVAENTSDCIYLRDSDNDRKPDCCPNGPGSPGCGAHDPDAALSDPSYKDACPATRWNGPHAEINDCNGNLIPDACDLSCTSLACQRTGWPDDPLFVDTGLPCFSDRDCDTAGGFGCDPQTNTCRLCGASRDDLPWTSSAGLCTPSPNHIPDECEFAKLEFDNFSSACSEEEPDPENPCVMEGIFRECIRQSEPRWEHMLLRCEYDDSNEDDGLDIVEPFENFLRRWDPCIIAPEASPDNQESVTAHWVKVYDPSSPLEDSVFESLRAACPLEVSTFNYRDDSYIRHNYPARGKLCSGTRMECEVCSASGLSCQGDSDCSSGETCLSCDSTDVCRTGVEELIEEAGRRLIFGSHDPDGKLADAGATCVCPSMPCNSQADCAELSPLSICVGTQACVVDTQCLSGDCFNPDGSDDGSNARFCAGETFCTCVHQVREDGGFLENACIAGYHAEFDPSDRWFNKVAISGPDHSDVYTAKMRPAGDERGNSSILDVVITPKPGTYISEVTGQPIDEPWYEQAWEDRYNAVSCINPELFLPDPPPDIPSFVLCECERVDFDPLQPEGPGNLRRGPCDPPPWPGEDLGGAVENVRPFVPFDDVDPTVYDPIVNRRFFKANAGGLNGDGTGWMGCDANMDPRVVFETGDVNDTGFAELCDAPILPEEVDGPSERGIFYDGWVEHDDLASSKYHRAGDQRLGEVTSPFIATQAYQPPAVDPKYPPDPIGVSAIWGQDLGVGRPSPYGPDGIIPAAGPYAVDIHGNFGRDAGNLLLMEFLTWRTEPPFNNGAMWELDPFFEGEQRFHPYAGPSSGPNLGFRDYNLDGLLDQGEVRPAGSENYIVDSFAGTTDGGVRGAYPFNRRRLVEDVVEVLDGFVDFDDFVDDDALARINCPDGATYAVVPPHLTAKPGDVVFPNGVLSGIVLLPPNSHMPRDFMMPASYTPIHNEDGSDPDDLLPRPPQNPQLSWNLFFHDLVRGIDVQFLDNTVPTENFLTSYAAHMYLHTWEQFPDLYDYDIFEPLPGPMINCLVGEWGIMARGGLVHPVPALKETPCTEWAKSVDLATVLIPGVEANLTLPVAEFVRDDSYYAFWNDNRFNERYYLWSAGSGFDEYMPGEGVLILHSDQPPFTLPPIGLYRPYHRIVQADGLGQLDLCDNTGDDGDPWPGSTGNTTFTCETNPASRWYSQNQCTGLDILDIQPVGDGSTELRLRWTPTNLSSLAFIRPPGGSSIPIGSEVRYQMHFIANDIFGGTWMRFFYVSDQTDPAIKPDGHNYIGGLRKVIPGGSELALDWNIAGLPDGQYRVFAELIPGEGVDGIEPSHTTPRPGFYNVGDGTLAVDHVAVNEIVTSGDAGFLLTSTTFVATDEQGQFIDFVQQGVQVGDQLAIDDIVSDPALRTISTIGPDGLSLWFSPPAASLPSQGGGRWFVANADRPARLEAWVAECIDPIESEWLVTSSLTQARPNDDDPDQDPYPHGFTGVPYTSFGGQVTFTIVEGATPFSAGDTFTFTTTGMTALSAPVVIVDGGISEDPIAVIEATQRVGFPPLEVTFDGRSSFDPNGDALEFVWNFGDGSPPVHGPVVQHVFVESGIRTVMLRAVSPGSGRFGETTTTVVVRDPDARLGDWNGDQGIDLVDYEQFARCIDESGPHGAVSSVECIEVFDFSDDWDVDLQDFDYFQAVFTQD